MVEGITGVADREVDLGAGEAMKSSHMSKDELPFVDEGLTGCETGGAAGVEGPPKSKKSSSLNTGGGGGVVAGLDALVGGG